MNPTSPFDMIVSFIGIIIAAGALLMSRPGSYGERWPRLTKIVCWGILAILTPFVLYKIGVIFLER